MRRKLGLLILLFTILIPCVPASARDPQESWINLHLLTPCTVRVDYHYTKNITISDVQSFGPSLYEVTHSPIDFKFEAYDADSYNFNLELKYELYMTQVIKITLTSGTQPPSSMEVPIEGDIIRFHFEVNTTPEPVYPSVDDITEEVVKHLSGQLQIYQETIHRGFQSFTGGLNNITVISGAIVLVLLAVAGVLYKSVKETN